jgi:hypothetical protein
MCQAARGYVLTQNEEQWTLFVPTKLLLLMKDGFSPSLSLLFLVKRTSLGSSQSQSKKERDLEQLVVPPFGLF